MTTKKANPDYSASAIALTNAQEVKEVYDDYHRLLAEQTLLEETLQNTDIFKAVQAAVAASDEQLLKVRAAIEHYGGYQSVERGEYALKQQRVSVIYSPELVRKHIPTYAAAIIKEVADGKIVDGLLKAKLIQPAEEQAIIGEKKLVEAWIIK